MRNPNGTRVFFSIPENGEPLAGPRGDQDKIAAANIAVTMAIVATHKRRL
jgi:hypothetical protein